MKHLIILTLIFLGIISHSQNYTDKYKADLCTCIVSEKATLQTADKIYNACFTKTMVNYAVFIDAQIKEEDKTKKIIAGQKVRLDLKQRFKYELAYNCDAYIDIIENKKQHVLQQFRSKKIDSTRIDKLNETIAMQPHWANYYNRGQFYYYIGDLNKAEQDLKKSIQENPLSQDVYATSQQSFLLALVYEEQKRYSEAINIYNIINSEVKNPSIELLKAIVTRKRDGYTFKPNAVLENGVEPIVGKKPVETRKRTAPRDTQIKTAQTKTNQTSSAIKSKDSIKSLRELFKLDN